jgi:glucose/arabinose dehydrogenase
MIRPSSIMLAAVVLASHVAAGAASAQVRTTLVASGLTQPVAFVQDPSDPTVQVIVQQDGRIRVLKDGVLREADYLDLRAVVQNSGEQGLLGLAFAPDYATSGRVFVNFVDLADDTVIARFRRSAEDPLRADPASRFDLRWPDGRRFIAQPFSNHNGGNLAFGPDSYLYVGMGDGGSGNDPMHLAQDPQSLLGKMLRIDVSVPDTDPEGYDVPSSNPFVGQPGVLGEIWSFGLRNPWRWSFDDPAHGGTGALVIGDVGQNRFEEIDFEPAGRGGRNYGWRNREGAHDNVPTLPPFSQPLVDPIFEYPRSVGQTVTGGFVYRGRLLGTSAQGRYFFGDFVASRVWSLRLTIDEATGEATASDLVEHTGDLGGAAANPSSFGVDAAGELYVVNYGGTVHRLFSDTPAPDPPPDPPPPPETPPGPGRRRPPDAPVVGFAVPRAPSETRGPDLAIRTTVTRADAVAGDARAISLARGPWGEVRIALADVNRDGREDVVWRITTGDTAHVWIWMDRVRRR